MIYGIALVYTQLATLLVLRIPAAHFPPQYPASYTVPRNRL